MRTILDIKITEEQKEEARKILELLRVEDDSEAFELGLTYLKVFLTEAGFNIDTDKARMDNDWFSLSELQVKESGEYFTDLISRTRAQTWSRIIILSLIYDKCPPILIFERFDEDI